MAIDSREVHVTRDGPYHQPWRISVVYLGHDHENMPTSKTFTHSCHETRDEAVRSARTLARSWCMRLVLRQRSVTT